MKQYRNLIKPYLVWAFVIIVIPLILIALYAFTEDGNEVLTFSFTLENFRKFLEATYMSVIFKSFKLGILTTLICLGLGYPLAFIISKCPEKSQNLLILLVTIPEWINMLLRTYAWMNLLSDNGIINRLLQLLGISPVTMMYTDFSVLVGLICNFMPFMIIPIHTSLSKMDKSLIEAAFDLGANKFQTFTKVIWKLSIPGVLNGIMMVFLLSISTFVIPKLLGAGLSDGYLQAQAEYQNAEREIQRTDAQVQEGYRRMQESTLKMEEIRQKIQQAEEEAAQLRAAVAVCENDILHSRQMLESLHSQKTETAEQSRSMESRMASLSEQTVQLRQKRESLQVTSEQAEQEWERLKQQAARRGQEYEQANGILQKLLVRQSELRVMQQTAAGQQEELKAQLTEQGMRQSALQQACSSQNMVYDAAREKAEQAKALFEQVQNQRAGFQKRYAHAVQALEEGRKNRDQAAFALREKRQRQKLLQDMERNMEGFGGSVKAVLRADGGKPRGVFGTVAQLITTDQKYGVALETALGGAMQNLIVENENAAKQWIRFLQQQRAGRATFLPLTSVRGRTLNETGLERHEGFIAMASELVRYDQRFSGVVQFLLGRVAVAEDLDSATALAKAYQYRFRIVTLDGQVINAGGSFTGGSAMRSGGMLTRRAELTALSGEVKALEQQEQAAAAAFQKAQAQSAQLEQQMEELQQRCRRAESEQVAAEAQLEKEQYLRKQNTERLEEAASQQAVLQQRMQETADKYTAAAEEAEEVEKAIQKGQEMLSQEADQRSALEQEQARLAEQRSQLKISMMELEKDMDTLSREIQQQSDQQDSMVEKLAQIDRDISTQEELIRQKQDEITRGNKTLEQMKTSRTDGQAEIRHWQQVHDAQDQQIREMQSGLRETNAVREKFSGEMSRLEERKIAVQSDYDGVIRQLLEQYELSLSEAQEQAQPLEDLQAAQRELQSLKSRIRGLGTVNVAAIAEYEEVSARYQFLSEQMQDAETAKRELEDLITSLTEEMQRIFSESFSIINRNFQEIFRDLFGGGEARLELTDPENVLESGIEIKVAPPGKVIKNLISLSGGEQSFVAIAIYFAILRLRPSPFCILDEIDAALDEGNVRRYAQYLQNFTDTTQFILVTHRRSAMEEASVLYGVTMQEDGISRLLRMEQEELQ